MAKKKRRNRSWLMQTIERVGMKEAATIGEFVLAWITVHSDLQRRPTVEEYNEWWDAAIATSYREQARFREAWPEFSTPSDLAATLGLDLTSPEVPSPHLWPDPLPT